MPKKVEYEFYIIEKYDKYERKREAAWVNCNYCGKKFLKRIQFIQENRNYCCPEHASLGNRKRVKVKCAYCGLEKEITQSKYDASKTKTYFCCRDHQNKAQKADSEIDYICNYVDGNFVEYRINAFEKYPNKCAYCNYDINEILIVHHIDNNRENNSIENLIILCRNCHYAVHNGLAILENRKLKWLDDKLFEI